MEREPTMRVLLVLISVGSWRDMLAQVHTSPDPRSSAVTENLSVANKSLEFVNVIRNDLRRNNDDYELFKPRHRLAPNTPRAPLPPHRSLILQPAHRLVPTRPPSPQSPQSPHKFNTDTRRREGDLNPSHADHEAGVFRSYTHSKHYKNERFNKLKRMLHKDKQLLRQDEQNEAEQNEAGQNEAGQNEAAQNEAEETEAERTEDEQKESEKTETEPTETEPTQAKDTTTTATPPTRTTTPLSPTTTLPSPTSTPRHPLTEQEGQDPVMRQRKDHSPSPDQIDMAPVRDPQIARIRIKGRLCQRSLMNMEGPSYDKEGKEVVPEYRPRHARGRQFHQTRAPALVLPRCCNCCKKSVLGCQ